jgi:hypothetical protein
LGHLSDLFFQRHALDQILDLSRVIAFGTIAAGALEEFVAIHSVGSLGFNCDQRLNSEAQ